MKSFAIIGLGRFGRSLAMRLFEMGYEVLAIDKDEDKVYEISEQVTQAVCADLMEAGVIRELALEEYDTAVVAIGNELAASILVTMQLKEIGIKYVLAKAMDENHKKVLTKVGADRVIIPENDAGLRVAAQLVQQNVFDVIDISDEYSIADIAVPSQWYGKTLTELDIRRKYSVNVIALKDKETGMITTIAPKPDCPLSENEAMVVIGENDNLRVLYRLK
ncbi:MAG: TrkA family potassium uptake protein [bacterium]|nr:TrkA family potassium uptake protein [bacterium]